MRNVSIPLPEKPEGSTADGGKLVRSQPTDHSANIIEQARQKYESGDIIGAIALLKSVPANAASGIQQTGKVIAQWQQDWAKAEAISNEINKALDDGKWDKVLDYKNHPEKLPNTQYWRNRIEPLFKQAAENLAKQALSKLENQGNQKSTQHKLPDTNQPATTENPNPTETPKSGF